MQVMTLQIYDIEALDELSTKPHIISVSNIYYDSVIDKIFEVIVVYNEEVDDTRILMFCEDVVQGAIAMEHNFWNEIKSAQNASEVVLLEGNELFCDYLLSSGPKSLGTNFNREQ